VRTRDEIDDGIRDGIVEVFLDEQGEERVRLTEKGWAALEDSFRRKGQPIPWIDGPGYRIHTHPDGRQSILCKTCGSISLNPNDVREKYCGQCHRSLA
jgi:DNA-binding PadR family transcriptional regulator